MTTAWNGTDTTPPPEGEMVETMSERGLQQQLVRYGRLWFTDTSKSMYVYYTPKYWRRIDDHH